MIPFRHHNRIVLNLLIRDLLQQVMDAIERGFFLVNALDHPPEGFRNVAVLQQILFGPCVVLLAAA